LQVKPYATDEAGPFPVFGGMTDQASRLIDDQQVSIFVNDFK
jgi:hypothetical protein